jgi:hypothetical protein
MPRAVFFSVVVMDVFIPNPFLDPILIKGQVKITNNIFEGVPSQ